MSNFVYFLLSLLPLASIACHHDSDYKLDYVSGLESPQNRFLGISERENIRMTAFYYLDDPTGFIATKIKEQLMPAAISYFQAVLKINRLTSNIKISPTLAGMCGNIEPPKVLSEEGVEADMIFFVKGLQNSQQGSTTAAARPCVLSSPTDRPILGVITFYYGSAWTGTSESAYEGDLLTALHELSHALGFTPGLFDNFIDPSTGKRLPNPLKTKLVNGKNVSVLSVEPLNTRLRAYFNCPTVDGAYLENQGGAGSKGSHFERRVFFNEFMTASEGQDLRISEFTLALFESSGWYTPDYSMADPLSWGQGRGCGFLDETCIDPETKKTNFNDEFCSTPGASGCTFVGTTKAFCGIMSVTKNTDLPAPFDYYGDDSLLTLDAFADNCPYNFGFSNLNCLNAATSKAIKEEYYGDGSMCFMANITKKSTSGSNLAYCFKQKCEENAPGEFILTLEISNKSIICPSEGSITIPGYQGVVHCPNTNYFCSTKAQKYCKRGCLGRGKCVNGECVCNKGYSGKSCLFKTNEPVTEDPGTGTNPGTSTGTDTNTGSNTGTDTGTGTGTGTSTGIGTGPDTNNGTGIEGTPTNPITNNNGNPTDTGIYTGDNESSNTNTSNKGAIMMDNKEYPAADSERPSGTFYPISIIIGIAIIANVILIVKVVKRLYRKLQRSRENIRTNQLSKQDNNPSSTARELKFGITSPSQNQTTTTDLLEEPSLRQSITPRILRKLNSIPFGNPIKEESGLDPASESVTQLTQIMQTTPRNLLDPPSLRQISKTDSKTIKKVPSIVKLGKNTQQVHIKSKGSQESLDSNQIKKSRMVVIENKFSFKS